MRAHSYDVTLLGMNPTLLNISGLVTLEYLNIHTI